MPRKKPAVKRRMYAGPEVERKLAFMLDRQLHLQDTQQQQAFHESQFGRLPGEIRDMIYEYVLVAPSSQSTRYLRVPDIAATNSGIPSAVGTVVNIESKTGSTASCQLASVHHAGPAKVSYVAILQTCRQINREAYHIFYARNSFHLMTAPILIGFLEGIGPVRRGELTSLHIEGLVIKQSIDKDALHHYCLENDVTPAARERLEACTFPALHPDLYRYQTRKVFEGCKNLSKLFLEMTTEDGFTYSIFLKYLLGLGKTMTYLVNEHHWMVAPSPSPASTGMEVAEVFQNYKSCFPCWARGARVRVEVDIIREIRESEHVMKKGFGSWVI